MKREARGTVCQFSGRTSLKGQEQRIPRLVSVWLAVGFLTGSLLGNSLPSDLRYVLLPCAGICSLAIFQPTGIALAATGFSTGLLSNLLTNPKDVPGISYKTKGTFEGRIRMVEEDFFNGKKALIDVGTIRWPMYTDLFFPAQIVFNGDDENLEGEWIRFTAEIRSRPASRSTSRYLYGSVARGAVHRLPERRPFFVPGIRVRRALEDGGKGQVSHLDGILRSIAAGDRSSLDAGTKAAMRRTGTSHLLAISGVHLGSALLLGALLCCPLAGFFSRSRMPRGFFIIQMSGGSIVCLYYLAVTGSSPSALRASIFAATAMVSVVGFRESNLPDSLAWSFLVIGSWSSTPQPDTSLALSMLACLGVWTAVSYPRRDPRGWLEGSVAAYIFTLPLVALLFRGIPILAPLWNVVIGFPFMVILIPMAVAGDAVSALWTRGACLIFNAWKSAAYPLACLLNWAGNIRWAYLELNLPGAVSASTASFLCLLLWWRGKRSLRWKALLILTPVVFGLAGHHAGERKLSERFYVAFPGLGKADATLIRTEGRAVLVDTGPPGIKGRDPPVAWCLRREGVGLIDLLFLSHPHPDHTGGSGYLLRNGRIKTLVLPSTPGDLLQWRSILKDVPRDVAVRFVNPGDQLRMGDMVFRISGSGNFPVVSKGDANNMSMILHVAWRDLDVLLTGDASWHRTVEAMKEISDLDILKIPHHGSGAGFPPEGWEEVMKSLRDFPGLISICTAGPAGAGNHPSERVTDWFRRAGLLFLLTGRGKGVTIAYPPGDRWFRRGTLLTRDICSDRKIVIF